LPEPDFLLRQGDTTSAITAILEDEAGTPVDIEGATIVFRMTPIEGGATKVDAAASNNQGADVNIGAVSYTWAAADTDTAGLFLAEWIVTFTSGDVQSYPNDGYLHVRVTPQLAGIPS
jgi:hypothetical protein